MQSEWHNRADYVWVNVYQTTFFHMRNLVWVPMSLHIIFAPRLHNLNRSGLWNYYQYSILSRCILRIKLAV